MTHVIPTRSIRTVTGRLWGLYSGRVAVLVDDTAEGVYDDVGPFDARLRQTEEVTTACASRSATTSS